MIVRRALVVALVCASCVACTTDASTPSPHSAPSPPAAVPYDNALPPAQAAIVLAPEQTTTLRVVDWDVVRRDVGLPELTSMSSEDERATFRSRITEDSPVLARPLLEGVDARLRARFGFGADDVSWEAHWSGLGFSGWALAFGPQVDMAAVARAVRAGVGPLRGAGLRRANRLVVTGISADGPTLGSDPTWAELVPDPGEAFLVRRGCVESPGAHEALEPAKGFAVTFGDHIATVRMNRDRTDLFARARLGGDRFGRVFRHPVADPSSGRIGYDVPRPPAAAALVRRDLLPFGACAPGD